MKKSLLWVLIFVLSVSMVATFSLTGCKEETAEEAVEEEAPVEEEVVEEEEPAEEAEEEEEVTVEGKKIGVMLAWASHEWFVSVMEGFRTRADEFGIEYTTVDSENDLDKSLAIIETFVEEGVDGILLIPVAGGNAHASAVNYAEDAGIPVLFDGVPQGEPTAYSLQAQFNMNRESGMEAAKYIKENWPEDKEVNVLTVNIPEYPNLNARTDGFLIGLLEGGVDFNWVAEVDGRGVIETSLEVCVAAFTAHPEINCSFGINDDSMFGAFKAAEQLDLDMGEMIFIGTGLEGPKAMESLLADNSHIVDTAMFATTIGYNMVNIFAEIFKGNEVPLRSTPPTKAITADNFYDYYNEDYSERLVEVIKIKVEPSNYPMDVGWDRNWYEVYKSNPEKFKEEYKY